MRVISMQRDAGPKPTLWRTCRALANNTRLEILRELVRHPGQPVSRVAVKIKLSRPVATGHLRHLAARGLLRARRSGAWVCYSVEPDPTIPESEPLVDALRDILRTEKQAVRRIFRLATAFTHPRRQAIYETLRKHDCTFAILRRETGISARALRRHLSKLARRGFLVASAGVYRAATPPGRIGELLAELAPQAAR